MKLGLFYFSRVVPKPVSVAVSAFKLWETWVTGVSARRRSPREALLGQLRDTGEHILVPAGPGANSGSELLNEELCLCVPGRPRQDPRH